MRRALGTCSVTPPSHFVGWDRDRLRAVSATFRTEPESAEITDTRFRERAGTPDWLAAVCGSRCSRPADGLSRVTKLTLAAASRDPMPRIDANVYVDGFNLYYSTLRDTSHRWLDLQALALRLLEPDFSLHRIRYFTAPLKIRQVDPGKRRRQHVYLRALRTIPDLTIHLGHFLSNPVRMPLAKPRPGQAPLVTVLRTEEKGSDANLAAWLTRDAAKRDCRAAFVITGDSDFTGVIQMVRREFTFPVHVVDPRKSSSRRLRSAATSYRLLDRKLLPWCQFPARLRDGTGAITKPEAWAG